MAEFVEVSATPARARMKETPKMREGREKAKSDCSDSDDETGPSVRRGLLGEFTRRHRFSIPTYQPPSDKVFSAITRRL